MEKSVSTYVVLATVAGFETICEVTVTAECITISAYHLQH
jgi:hypothetical protein